MKGRYQKMIEIVKNIGITEDYINNCIVTRNDNRLVRINNTMLGLFIFMKMNDLSGPSLSRISNNSYQIFKNSILYCKFLSY